MAGLNEKSLRCFAHQRPQALLIYEVHRLRKRRSVIPILFMWTGKYLRFGVMFIEVQNSA